MGNIRQRGRIWWIRYYINGKLYAESARSIHEEDAVALLAQRERERGVCKDKIPRGATRNLGTVGHIYFLLVAATQHVKIGFAADVPKRLKTIQAANPTPVELLGSIPGTMQLERKLHRMFKKHHVRGEWFNAAPIALEIQRILNGTSQRLERFEKPAPVVPLVAHAPNISGHLAAPDVQANPEQLAA